MLKFKTSCAVLAYLSSNLLNEVGLSLFRYFEVGLRVCDIVFKKFTFAISSPDEFLWHLTYKERLQRLKLPTLVYRRARGDMIEVYKILHGYYDLEAVPCL